MIHRVCRFTTATAVAMTLFLSLHVTAQSTEITQIDLPAQPLAQAIQAVARQASINILVDPRLVEGREAPAVKAEMSIQQALNVLLQGTGLTPRYVDDKTITLVTVAPIATKTSADTSQIGASNLRLAQATENPDSSKSASEESSDSSDDSSSVKLEEIVVTAQKRVEPLQDVPVPVSTLNGEQLTRTSQLRIEDYYRTIPGLSITPQGNNGETALSIRGVAAIGKSNPTVGLVVDEISYGASVVTGPNAVTAADIDPGDVARIEVLRGPQGTLYGASSIGGLLKFVTVDPSTEKLSGRVQMGATSVDSSSDAGHSIRGNVNIPMSETLAVRLSGFTVHDPGYIDNVGTGERDVNDRDSNGGRLSTLWQPSDNLSVKLSALVQKTERGGVSDVDTRFGQDAFKQSMLTGTGALDRESQVYSATITGRVGLVELTSATGYSNDKTFHDLEIQNAFLQGQAFSFFGVDRVVARVDRDVSKLSQELRASMPFGERVKALIGAFYTEEEVEILADTVATDSAQQVFGTLAYNAYGVNNPAGPAVYKDAALFSTLTVDLTDRLDIQVGGRYSDNSQVLPVTIGGPLISGYPSNPFSTPDVEAKDSAFTYLITPRLKISPNLMLYARLASGYRPGGINIACGRPDVPCAYDSDTTRNFDVGAKGSALDGALSFDFSVYHYDWSDIQLADLITSDFLFFYTVNAAKASSNGVELSIDAKLSNALKLSAWVAVNDAKLDKAMPFSSFGLAGDAGEILPYATRVSSSLSLDWLFPLGAAAGNLGGALSYVGDRTGNFKQFGFLETDPVAPREYYPGYTQLDLYARAAYAGWDVSLFINNVTGERGILRNGSDYGNPAEFVEFTQPRTVGVSLSKSF